MVNEISTLIHSMRHIAPVHAHTMSKSEVKEFYIANFHKEMKKHGLQFYILPKAETLMGQANDYISVKPINCEKIFDPAYVQSRISRIVLVNEKQKEIRFHHTALHETPVQIAQVRISSKTGQTSIGADFTVRVRSHDEEQNILELFHEIQEKTLTQYNAKRVNEIDVQNHAAGHQFHPMHTILIHDNKAKKTKNSAHHKNEKRASSAKKHAQVIHQIKKAGMKKAEQKKADECRYDHDVRIEKDLRHYEIVHEDVNKKTI